MSYAYEYARGGRQPMIIENIPCVTDRTVNGGKEFGTVDDLKLKNIDTDIANAVISRYWKGIEGSNSNAVIVAMRGRNPENPSDRTVGAPTEQRLEPNSQGICNTLTSVQKDNLVMETVRIKQATKEGYIECKIGGVADLSFPSSETRRGRVQEGGDVCPTLTTGETNICKIEGCRIRKMTEEEYQKAMDKYYRHRIRIRKLTPLECWRLMDFTDEDFHKAEAVNSNTQLYKQAGNSIIRNVLVAIFGQLLEGKEDAYRKL